MNLNAELPLPPSPGSVIDCVGGGLIELCDRLVAQRLGISEVEIVGEAGYRCTIKSATETELAADAAHRNRR